MFCSSNIRVNQDASGEDQNETSVAVSPTNPLNLVAGARDRRNGIERNGFYASLDGGATWTDGVLTEGTYTYQSDPVVAACADGSFVYASLSFNSGGSGGIFAYRSTDGGLTWPQKSTVVTATPSTRSGSPATPRRPPPPGTGSTSGTASSRPGPVRSA